VSTEFYGYIIKAVQTGLSDDESLVHDKVQAQREIATQFRMGADAVEVITLFKGPSASFTTKEDAMEAFKV
jgi:hypothetical protein